MIHSRKWQGILQQRFIRYRMWLQRYQVRQHLLMAPRRMLSNMGGLDTYRAEKVHELRRLHD